MYYLIQASTSYDSKLCFSKSSEKPPEMTKLLENSQRSLDNLQENLLANFRKKLKFFGIPSKFRY